MKRFVKLIGVLIIFASVVWVVGCANQEEKEPAKEEMASSTVFLKHQVADYGAWRPLYDADAQRRADAGMTEMGVYRDANDENMVLIAWETNNLDALNAMLASPDLAEKMKAAGVASGVETWVVGALQEGKGMVFLQHSVADYTAWRPLYDADAKRRAEAGLQEMGVYRSADDENMILIVWGAENGSTVSGMLQSPDLADKMKEAGVTSEPQAWMAMSM